MARPGTTKRAKGIGARAKKPRPTLKLYWCETEDHGEDWFIVARTALGACRQHEEGEGYDPGDADAEFICELPAALQKTEAGWPSREVLEACGAEMLSGDGGDGRARTVRINGRVFGEGDVFTLAAARVGQLTKH